MPNKLLFLLLNAFLLTSTRAQFTGCDYFQNVVPGQTYDIFSPGYGNYYQAGINCRWRALGPVNSKLTLNCIDVTLPQNNCNDRLEISWSGTNDPNPNWYCTSQTFSSTTAGNSIDITGNWIHSWKVSLPVSLYNCKPHLQANAIVGDVKFRIVNGDKTGVNEFTMMAGIVDTRDRNVYCGGTIISNSHVVTSAHCLTNRAATTLSVLIGDDDYATTSDTPYAVFYPVGSFTVHPNFDRNTNLNDIGIIITAASIAYNVAVGPACLPFAYETVPFTSSVVEAVGWGTIFYGGEISTKLRKVSLNVIGNAACSAYYSNIASTQMCVKTPGKDTCQVAPYVFACIHLKYDSGGPLYYSGLTGSRKFLVAQVSLGEGCGGSAPSLNTRITKYMDWIEKNTGPLCHRTIE